MTVAVTVVRRSLAGLLAEQAVENAKLHPRARAKLAVDLIGGCVIWTGALDKSGYPKRFAALTGDVPPGTHRHHTCGNRRCVLRDHLLVVSPAVHAALHTARRATCHRGHVWGPETTLVESGRRRCRPCRRAWRATWLARRREAAA